MSTTISTSVLPKAWLFGKPSTKYVAIALLALSYASATLIASHMLLMSKVGAEETPNPFRDTETLLTVMSVIGALTAIFVPLAQAFAMALVAKLARPPRMVTISESWLWVLIAQVPFILIVHLLRALGGFELASSAASLPARIVFAGVMGLVYGAFLWRVAKAPLARVGIISALMLVINGTLVALGA